MEEEKREVEVVYINYFDAIDMARVGNIMQICTNVISNVSPKTLYFMFATPGGEVAAGIALYNFLKAISPKVVMHNMGIVNSIGNVIFAAGDERYASSHSTFLFHDVEMGLQGSFNTHKLGELKSSLEGDQDKIAGIIAGCTSMTDAEIRQFFLTGESKSATFALEKGFVHEVRNVTLKPEDLFININYGNPQA